MKKYINRKLYNTETAALIAAYNGDLAIQSLHRKKNGEYFLFTVTRSPVVTQNITPLSYEQAMDWVEAHYKDEELKVIKSDMIRELHVRLHDSTIRAIKAEAGKLNMSVSGYLEHLFGKGPKK